MGRWCGEVVWGGSYGFASFVFFCVLLCSRVTDRHNIPNSIPNNVIPNKGSPFHVSSTDPPVPVCLSSVARAFSPVPNMAGKRIRAAFLFLAARSSLFETLLSNSNES